MNFTVDKSGDKGVLRFEGALTIQRANELQTALLGALDSAGQVNLSLDRVTEVDLACLQLFYAAHRAAVSMNKSLALTGHTPKELQQALEEAGFSDCPPFREWAVNSRE